MDQKYYRRLLGRSKQNQLPMITYLTDVCSEFTIDYEVIKNKQKLRFLF